MAKAVITGHKQVLQNLGKLQSKVLLNTVRAVDTSLIDLVNHAKAGHAGNMAHAGGRYQNRTSNLTNSIQHRLESISAEKVVGVAWAGMEYGYWVEFGAMNVRTGRMNRPYPFMYPALMYAKIRLNERMRNILR